MDTRRSLVKTPGQLTEVPLGDTAATYQHKRKNFGYSLTITHGYDCIN